METENSKANLGFLNSTRTEKPKKIFMKKRLVFWLTWARDELRQSPEVATNLNLQRSKFVAEA